MHNIAMPDYHTNALNVSLRSLSDSVLLRAAIEHLAEHSATINTELMEMVLAEIPAFSESRNPEVIPDLAAHGPEHFWNPAARTPSSRGGGELALTGQNIFPISPTACTHRG